MGYLDYNATAPMHPAAREAWLEAVDCAWQNPSSPYRASAQVRNRLEAAREKVAGWLNCPPERVVFNSGATEGANALLAYVAGRKDRKTALGLFAPTEHPAIIEPAERYFCDRKRWLRIDSQGRIDLADAAKKIAGDRPGIVSAMAANNETGVVQPWAEIAGLCRAHGVFYYCDASQWIGKMPSDGLGDCAFLTASAHKFGGPKGVGILVLPEACNDFRSMVGGEQEGGFRAGTENYPAVAAMVAAWEASEKACREQAEGRCRMRKNFEALVREKIPEVRIPGEEAKRLWNTVALILPRFENHRWVTKLDAKGFQVSTGSACATATEAPSHVLAAMRFSPAEARRAIRISSGWGTAEAEWNALALAIGEVFEELKREGDSSLTEVISL